MSFLRGKSTSYSRFALPNNTPLSRVDELVDAWPFRDLTGDDLEGNGFVSYRNLLDASIDRGLLEGHVDLWLTGLRRDVKKAPAALVRAQVARELADARTVNPNLGKSAIKEITADVRLSLNKKAQPRPAHGAVLANLSTGLLYVDGIASAHDWMAKRLDLTPVYVDGSVNADYLAWCAWRAGHDVDTPCTPTGDIAFLEPRDAGAQFDGIHNVNELLDYWMGQQQATIANLGLIYAVDDCGDAHNVSVTLQAAGLKVCGLEWPEEVVNEAGSLDEKLARRLSFVMQFEKTLAEDFMQFAQLAVANKLPEKFLELTA